MRGRLVTACLTVGLTLLAIQPLAAQGTSLPSLTGSWQLTLMPATPTASVPVRIPALATFTSDGSVIETDGSEVVRMRVEGISLHGTPGHGIWQPGPAIGNLFIQFISLLVNDNETLHAKKIVTMTGSLDSTGNHFTGGYGFELVDLGGAVIATGSGRVSGQKIPHPLLP
jgi:hypothetical protein